MKAGWTEVALGEVLTQDRSYVTTLEPRIFKKLSVSLYGRGVSMDTPVHADNVKMDKHQFARAGQVIVSEIWAKKGALGIVPEAGEGALVTSHFFLFDIHSPRLCSGWMKWLLKGNYFESQLSAGSFGTTGYASVRPAKFLAATCPLPPLAEQERIVARLDAIETRLARVRELQDEANAARDAFTTSLHIALADGRTVSLGEIVKLHEEICEVRADGSYPQVGIRSFGQGFFKKPPVTGSETTYRSFNTLRSGMFVLSQVKGWEGAIGVCESDLDGWFVSPEYRTFKCIEGESDPTYLRQLVATSWFQHQIAAATRGVGARRERIRPEMMLAMEMPFPRFEAQRSAVSILAKLRAGAAISSRADRATAALLPSLLDRIFNS